MTELQNNLSLNSGFVDKSRTFLAAISPFLVLLITWLLYSEIVSAYKKQFGENISSFICMGTEFMEPSETPEGMFYFEQSKGYDGQFFYFIARDPFITGDMYKRIDVPAYRYQRIIYPLLAHIAAGGNIARIPKMMVRVNLFAIMIGTMFVILMLRMNGLSSWYALFYPLMNGFLLTLLRDLSGPVSMAFLIAAIYFLTMRKDILCAVLLSLAVLSREVTAAVIPVLILDQVFMKKQPRRAFVPALSLVPFILWQIYIYVRLHIPPWTGGRRNFGAPLTAMLSHIREITTSGEKLLSEQALLVLFVAITILTIAAAVRHLLKTRSIISLCLLGYSIMPLMMTHNVWIEPWSYCRIALPVSVFLLISFIESRDRFALIPLSMHVLLFTITLHWLKIV